MNLTPYPPDFKRLITEEVDFERAFSALSGYEHFRTEAARGYVRALQLRTQEAWDHFQRAELLYREQASLPDSELHYFTLRVYALDNAFIEEAIGEAPDAAEATDREMLRLLEDPRPENPLTDELVIAETAYYKILRGDYALALEGFQTLLLGTRRRFRTQEVGFSCGAAAAAKELGRHQKAEKYYETASIGMDMLTSPFKIALYSARLYTLMTHWGRPHEAEAWLDRIRALKCPEESKAVFMDRAKILTAASCREQRIVIGG